ncbi:squalene--hopene cyclase [Dyella acidisoli]|uniref:Squalene-hopene cyclase n=1 Tax=Dyella acidisoli TaxID=1867834 RepID=A0ABQ5XS62_9GAMM|nr:squalene--hopene cyclase [Dyella acidisoli]GLQ94597.1 squalene-hopene cyclase [Dyella acidisoli]
MDVQTPTASTSTHDIPHKQRKADAERFSLLESAIERAAQGLTDAQQADGHWVYELESDASSTAEYIMLTHYLGEPPKLEQHQKMARYLHRTQLTDGGWPLYAGGPINVSSSVKAYYALKIMGETEDTEPMQRARRAILAHGGAEASNVFTRTLLALHGIVPWQAVPMMPVEIIQLPAWFPVHLSKMSPVARAFLVPLLVVNAKRPQARHAYQVGIDQLFNVAPSGLHLLPRAPHQSAGLFVFFHGLDTLLRATERLFPKHARQRAIEAAVAFVEEHLDSKEGLGGIFPAAAMVVMMYDALGYPKDHLQRAKSRQAVEHYLAAGELEAYCQPSRSPVWDTAFAAHALLETDTPVAQVAAVRGLDWLRTHQTLDVRGDWAIRRPHVRPGGWAFQYGNVHYPDVDDTAVVAAAMDRASKSSHSETYREAVARSLEWIVGMQCHNGGWGAFEAENTHTYLDSIPFSDHGAMTDPPTADVSSRCLSLLAQLGQLPAASESANRAINFLWREQQPNGSWYGRWGVNYIYGTWLALCALNAAGVAHETPRLQRAVQWLIAIQNADGGWGESCASYECDYRHFSHANSTASQTSWALLGLMAAGQINHPSVKRGISYLLATQYQDGLWEDELVTGTGIPRVLYLRYHGYPKFFPLWALARYRNLRRAGTAHVAVGM